MLYYVKSDVLVRSMPVTLGEADQPDRIRRLYFHASNIENKRNNERREFIFDFAQVEQKPKGPVLRLSVSYSHGGKKTKPETILKEARKAGLHFSAGDLQAALRVFQRQTEADFFINKDAHGFLREQFDLWMYQYIFHEETIFEQKRLSQLQAIQAIAYDIIDFIAQFEDELRRVWEKPKFVRGVNYVLTLDRLPVALLRKLIKHKGTKTQTEEWRRLGMVDAAFTPATLMQNGEELPLHDSKTGPINGKYRFLPLDTKHFKSLELEILNALGNLDEALDGELAADCFLGSGTSITVAQKLGRKWLGIEMGDCFKECYSAEGKGELFGILGSMKIVLFGDEKFKLSDKPRRCRLSQDMNWQGGGVFKYYTLEQYEETLRNSRYEDGEQVQQDSAKSPFEQYVFFGDDKLTGAVQSKNGTLDINLHNLYPDIDIAESLSNILGKQVRKRTADAVTFADGSIEKTDPAKMTEEEKRHFVSLIKPYLWWGE